jgi:hypothetical protein
MEGHYSGVTVPSKPGNRRVNAEARRLMVWEVPSTNRKLVFVVRRVEGSRFFVMNSDEMKSPVAPQSTRMVAWIPLMVAVSLSSG